MDSNSEINPPALDPILQRAKRVKILIYALRDDLTCWDPTPVAMSQSDLALARAASEIEQAVLAIDDVVADIQDGIKWLGQTLFDNSQLLPDEAIDGLPSGYRIERLSTTTTVNAPCRFRWRILGRTEHGQMRENLSAAVEDAIKHLSERHGNGEAV